MHNIFTALLVCLCTLSSLAQQVQKIQPQAWVNNIPISSQKILQDNGSYQYLLIDEQVNLLRETVYRHYAVKVLNADGIQSMSDINITFDHSYQKLLVHDIKIIREGKEIDKLQQSKVQTFQRETSMERSLYDGSLSAVVNLSDVRKNDIIEYAYSIVGFNPIHQGQFSTVFYQQHTVPVNRIYSRLLCDTNLDIQYRLFEGAAKPTVKQTNTMQEYLWDVEALDYLLYDNNVPAWYDPHRHVAISTFKDWKEVVDWALPLYEYSKSQVSKLNPVLENTFTKETTILSLIRMVQDDIRYLGFESGIGAYKPHPPQKIFNQRYGDCKDKSLLLVALLRKEGLEAYPMLVNTQLKEDLVEQLPSNRAFDHCVVNFRFQGADYFVDPTISNQGGDLAHMSFPNYQRGLIIKQGNSELISIPQSIIPTINIKELITVDEIGGEADLLIRSEYTGSKADFIRSNFNTDSRASIQQSYLNYYHSLYTSLKSVDSVKFFDYERSSTNKVVVEEHYQIENFWLTSDDSSYLYCEIYPLVLESQLGYPKTTQRSMPYYMGEPYSFSQTTQVDMPEDWPVQPLDVNINGDGFAYKNIIQSNGRTVSVTHNYSLHKEYIEGNSAEEMLSKHQDIQNEFNYYLTYYHSLAGFSLSWVSVVLVLIAIGAGIFICFRIYDQYDPPAWKYAEDKPIGGWLILPAIGLTLSPLVQGADIFSDDYFNQNSWESIFSTGIDNPVQYALFFGAELVFNTLFFVFTMMVLLAFYQRRTSLPRLITFYYALGFIIPVMDLWIAEAIIPSQLTDQHRMEVYKEVGRLIIGAAIWVPYFHLSERVKSTFCKQRHNDDTTEDIYTDFNNGAMLSTSTYQ